MGRTRAHQRPDLQHGVDVQLIGSELLAEAASGTAVIDTESHGLSTGIKRDNRNRLKTMMRWWQRNLPDYYELAVKELSADELADPTIYWWKNKHDLRYDGLDPQAVKLFLAAMHQVEDRP